MPSRTLLVANVLAAYALLAALALCAQALGHAYLHWLQSLGSPPALPALTRAFSLPLLGLHEHATTGPWLTWLAWGSAALWPVLIAAGVVRGRLPSTSITALMLPWLSLLLAAALLAALGLWLPFAPL